MTMLKNLRMRNNIRRLSAVCEEALRRWPKEDNVVPTAAIQYIYDAAVASGIDIEELVEWAVENNVDSPITNI